MTASTHKSGLQVPTPAVVEEADDDSSQEVTNQDGQVGHLNVRHNQLHKFLNRNKRITTDGNIRYCCIWKTVQCHSTDYSHCRLPAGSSDDVGRVHSWRRHICRVVERAVVGVVLLQGPFSGVLD